MFDKEIQFIKHHQEKYDGSGYPDRLKGRDIPFGARILAVAVAFAAMTSDRWYRPAYSLNEAIDEIISGSGREFDPDIVDAFETAAEKNLALWSQEATGDLDMAVPASSSDTPSN